MVHNNTKYWSLTWETNVKQKKLPNEETLQGFFGRIADEAIFQYEIGQIRAKEHIQGMFTLNGPRKSKTATLELFKGRFKNVSGLTLTPVYDKLAIKSYVTKSEGRTKGPFYGGRKSVYDNKFAKAELRVWQKEFYEEITGLAKDVLKDRKVIWVQDSCGNTGKSWFQKWLRVGQKELEVRALPVSRVDRLLAAVHTITKSTQVDAFTIDLTRTQGEEESFKDLFSAIESIKNGYTVDVMYGKYNETLFEPPMVIIFTNNRIEDFYKYLSPDRWKVYAISADGDLAKYYIESSTYINLTDIKSERKKLGLEEILDPFDGCADQEQKKILTKQ